MQLTQETITVMKQLSGEKRSELPAILPMKRGFRPFHLSSASETASVMISSIHWKHSLFTTNLFPLLEQQ